MRDIRLLNTPLAPNPVLDALAEATPDAGGLASFVGKVRATDGVEALELSHYEPLTLPGMQSLAQQALERFALDGVLAWHRVGTMQPGDGIVLVAAAARHRRAAFDAVDFLMDHLKSAAWFWKRERRGQGSDGSWNWIEPRRDVHAALARWAGEGV